ncbi:DUF3102 domain-containing protein [cf. Phormidesmis sp. LEGE 11477]|uniref:DUF3102 domain-containing protein n=1 Tax=cf. Phormidesmis sp. LEGE 11477 TaxID=1828680 RepID=UPI00187F1498|nr:DUF3102 domain-containing protein [cf. Phormidesmis sp. LEGE 11477]MBE9064280.1 DUF3102 domain-containing protein [cf. Phormidesmis sp. LEGE 11477]
MARSATPATINHLFDYDSLEASQRSIVQQRTGEIRERLRRSAQDVWEIGQKLSDVRTRLKYGQFLTWIKAEFGWSQRTAYNFINVYETFGDRFANLAKVNIATSLLYQLASPSVPDELRDQIIRAAEQGDTMTAKELRETIQKRRLAESAKAQKDRAQKRLLAKADKPPTQRMSKQGGEGQQQPGDASSGPAGRPEIITVIARSIDDEAAVEGILANADGGKGVSRIDGYKAKQKTAQKTQIAPGWYQLEGQHLVFCGDTAIPIFAKWAPMAKLAIAITGNDWAHDWLIDQAENVVVIPNAEYSDDKLKQLLKLLSRPGDIVMFPWLPEEKILAIAHRLGRTVYAGEANLGKCERAIAASGLEATAIEPNYVAELVG